VHKIKLFSRASSPSPWNCSNRIRSFSSEARSRWKIRLLRSSVTRSFPFRRGRSTQILLPAPLLDVALSPARGPLSPVNS